MLAQLEHMIPIRRFSSGRRTVVYHHVRDEAERRGHAVLVDHVDRALAHERATRALENQWSAQNRRPQHAVALPALDNRADQVLAGIRDVARGQAKGLPPGHPMVAAASRLLAEVFPNGVAAVASLPYVDQVLAMETILGVLQGELADTARELGLGPRVQQLAEITRDYRRLVDAGRVAVTYPEVRAARTRGQQYLREVIAIVMGTYYDSDDPAHLAARDALLAPLADQLVRLGARARARLRRRDREPDDGDGDDDDDSDGDATATA